MYQNYFVVNGKKYYTGTVFIVKDLCANQVKASFVCYDTDYHVYVYKIGNCMSRTPDQWFEKLFICVTDKVDEKVHLPITKTKKDRNIDGLVLGWIWYIFLMSLSAIFKDAIGLWILISIVFFTWRAKKIKEEGTYIEW